MDRRLKVKTHPKGKDGAAPPMVFTIDDFPSRVVVRRGERRANGCGILELLTLGAATGSIIEVAAAGEDEELAIAAITSLVMEEFGEERGT